MKTVLISLALFVSSLFADSTGIGPSCLEGPFNNLSSIYTLTAYAPRNLLYNGLKVNDLGLFQATVFQYCPWTGNQSSFCPNGTDMAFVGTLTPVGFLPLIHLRMSLLTKEQSVEVPGGQDLYVSANGELDITVQHSHSFPPGSYPEYIGWKWYRLPVNQPPVFGCPTDDPMYNCEPPTGFFVFRAPSATVSGVVACPQTFGNTTSVSLWAVTPQFNRTDCVALEGLGTHPYSGVNPPVWAYY
jgi:hypothetical protein